MFSGGTKGLLVISAICIMLASSGCDFTTLLNNSSAGHGSTVSTKTTSTITAPVVQPPPPASPLTVQPECDPNYSGACVPIASDVDCAGGSGNGPAYVQGPVNVVGTDIYGLDRDGNGVGCQ